MNHFILIFLTYFFISCAPHNQSFFNAFEPIEEESHTSEIVFYEEDREGNQDFPEEFMSDKLDLVFVVDFQSGMQNLFNKNIFGDDFLKRFEDYDWKFAYTNTGMSAAFFEEKEKGQQCQWGKGVFQSLFAVTLTSDFLFYSAGKNLKGCFKGSKKSVGANGQNLRFEHNKKWLNNFFLTKNEPDYQDIFNSTFLKPSQMYRNSSHPREQKGGSYPGPALLFSLFDNKEEFIREDSQVVYVVITTNDFQAKIEAQSLRQEFQSKYKNGERLHVISVVVKDDSQSCLARLKKMKIASVKKANYLMQLSEDMGASVIDICSDNIREKLSQGIQKYLYPTISL